MKLLTATLILAPAFLVPGGAALSTEYKTDRALKMEIESTLKMETTSMEITRDGEPMQGGGGGGASEVRHKEVHVDKVLAVKDGKPTKVRRTFETLNGKTSMTIQDNPVERENECPLEGVTLEIKRDDDGKVDVGAVEGKAPDGKELEHHVPENFLDGLLPDGDKKVDATWDLDSDAIKRALRLDVSEALYPRPERPEGGGEGEGRGRGRRGGMRGGGGNLNFLGNAEWHGKAKLVATDKDVDGKPCAVIELKLEASGDLPEPEMGGGRRGRMFEPTLGALPAVKSTYDVTLEGKFLFSTQAKRPVSLDLDGSAKTDVDREMKREDATVKFHIVMEGTIAYKVAVSEESAKAEK
jgi:hypothetical protein